MDKSILVYLILTALVLCFAVYVKAENYACENRGTLSYARSRVAEFAIWFLLAGVSACRIAVGNDYWPYRFNFRLIMQNRHVSSEIGFNSIVRAIQGLFGYDKYLPVFGFFSLITVFFFVSAMHHLAENYIFSLFLLMTGGYYFNSLNSVRYYLALAIALWAIHFIFREDYISFFLWILIGANFHKSILLVIPVYIAVYFLSKLDLKAWMAAGYVLITAAAMILKDPLRTMFFKIYPFYEASEFDNGDVSVTNILKCIAVIVLFLISYRFGSSEDPKKERRYRFFLHLNAIALIVFVCGGFIPESDRIGYYMSATNVFLIPGLIGRIKEDRVKRFMTFCVVSAFLLYFAFLLHGMYDINIRLLPYRNWIFQ
ncbi:MAG: EpsG family protein [Lachnospiraceae bacterium]|nr:EpsG family protein [Lachnospiraceae bacterium]